MGMTIRFKSGSAWILAVAILGAVPAGAGDPRIDPLIEMLSKNPNYRVRVQAARSLGRLRLPEAVPALLKALGDEEPLVVVTAASALGAIGSAEAIEPLRKLAASKDPAVKSQAEAAIKQIETILKLSGKEGVKDLGALAQMQGMKAFLGIGKMGDASGTGRDDLKESLRHAVMDEAGRTLGYALLPEGAGAADIEKLTKSKGVQAYLIQGSIVRIVNQGGSIEAQVSLILLSNPGNEIRAMVTGKAKIDVPSGTSDPAALSDIAKEAVDAAGRGGFHGLTQHLESQTK